MAMNKLEVVTTSKSYLHPHSTVMFSKTMCKGCAGTRSVTSLLLSEVSPGGNLDDTRACSKRDSCFHPLEKLCASSC